jgi:hypothetical protein
MAGTHIHIFSEWFSEVQQQPKHLIVSQASHFTNLQHPIQYYPAIKSWSTEGRHIS